jgi:hypothetical protein
MNKDQSDFDPDEEFYNKAMSAFRDLCNRAKAAHELHFAIALMPEFRGMQDAGWSTAFEATHAYEDFADLLETIDKSRSIYPRVALAFYNHVAEGSGFYEVPKKLMLTIEGRGNNMSPFQNLVEKHKVTGEAIAPNANRIMKDLIGHATELGLARLVEVFRDAFDADVRNAVAHADYIIWEDGLRLPRKSGGIPKVIAWSEFTHVINRGLNLFGAMREVRHEFVCSYYPPKTIRSRLCADDPEEECTIYYNPETARFGFRSGK